MKAELDFLDLLQRLHSPELDDIMCFITKLGDAGMVWIVVCAVLFIYPKTRRCSLAVGLALIFDAILCNVVLKPAFAGCGPAMSTMPSACLSHAQATILSRPDIRRHPLRSCRHCSLQANRNSASRRWCWPDLSHFPGCTSMSTTRPIFWAVCWSAGCPVWSETGRQKRFSG